MTALTACEGIALIAFIVALAMARRQRKKKGEEDQRRLPPFPWWAKTLAVLVALAVLITPYVALVSRNARRKPPIPVLTYPGVPLSGAGKLAAPGSGSAWPVIAGMAIAIGVVLTLAVLSRRRHSYDRPRNRVAALSESLAAGSAALEAGGEPREAIIACYAAMERGFAAAGSAPGAADTPAEVLARATDADLIRSASAEVLTSLFRRARYSAEPMTSADADAAASALAQMRADLKDLEASGEPADAGARP